ncbi:hypothetical protein P280DRAFT_333655 [Massarina eburnea CBS 473.64]|uniref:Uncharacterized protein n=1 Tax=Massarina eburnea CBS 473.64 TaxID=1395130 RepID=A0A6A6S1H8_9PLEO|nr:hypothetical protein P280DRAFT_333655 [Massarina eburnea CBS 473.64]
MPACRGPTILISHGRPCRNHRTCHPATQLPPDRVSIPQQHFTGAHLYLNHPVSRSITISIFHFHSTVLYPSAPSDISLCARLHRRRGIHSPGGQQRRARRYRSRQSPSQPAQTLKLLLSDHSQLLRNTVNPPWYHAPRALDCSLSLSALLPQLPQLPQILLEGRVQRHASVFAIASHSRALLSAICCL